MGRRARHRRRPDRRGAGFTVGIAAISSTVLALAAAGGTYALFSASVPVGPVQVQAATAALQVTSQPTPMPTNLLLGTATVSTFVVRNSGSIPLTLRVDSLVASASNAMTLKSTVNVWQTATTCAATPPATSASVPVWSGTPVAATPTAYSGTPFTLVQAGTSLAANATSTLCVGVTLATDTDNTAQGLSSTLTLTIGGVQVTS